MAVTIRETWTGGDSGDTPSGSAPWTATDATIVRAKAVYIGSPTIGDKFEYTLHFPTGDLTLRLQYTATNTFEFRRISTLSGQTFDVLMATITSSTQRPVAGEPVNLRFKVTRGASDGLTSVTVSYGRSSNTDNIVPGAFNLTGELTPTGADYALTGNSFKFYNSIGGRTPDGGGDPTLVAGTWSEAASFNIEEKLAIVGGVLVPQYGTFDSSFHRLTGLGLASANYRVNLTVTPNIEDGAFYGPTIRNSGSGGECYAFEIFDSGPFGYFATIYYVSPTFSFDLLGQLEVDTPLAAGPHVLSLRGEGSTLTASIDGVDVVTATDARLTAAGDPGCEGAQFDDLVYEWSSSQWELDDLADVTPPADPCGMVASQDEYRTPGSGDLDGVRTDEWPAQGIWYKHPAVGLPTDKIVRNWDTALKQGPGRSVYLDRSIGLGTDDYCVESRHVYPLSGAPGGLVRTLFWEDTFDDALSGSDLDGRVHDGATWERMDSGQQGPNAKVDGSGRVYQPAGDPGLTVYRVSGLAGLPAEYDVEIDVYVNSHAAGDVGAPVRVQPNGSAPSLDEQATWSYFWRVQQNQSVPYKNFYHAGVDSKPVGGIGSASEMGAIGDTCTFIATVRGQGADPGFVRIYFQDFEHEEADFYDGQFGSRVNFDDGPPGLVFITQLGGGPGSAPEGPLRIAAYRIYTYTTIPPGDPAIARVEVLARYDPTTDTGFVWRETYDNETTLYQLFERNAGVNHELLRDFGSVAAGTESSIRLQVAGTLLHCVRQGITSGTVDTATDTDFDGNPITEHPTGEPGLGAEDASGTGSYLALRRFTVYSELGVLPPCTGDPDNPYPTEYPPPTNPGQRLTWREGNGEWRAVLVPDGVNPSRIRRYANGRSRNVLGAWRMVNGIWRQTIGYDEQAPPPDTPLMPYFDPCNLIDVALPPVSVDPITGRFYGISNAPLSLTGPLFTGAKFPISGGGTPGMLADAASRGVTVILSQGGYAQYLLNGLYNRAHFIDIWISKLTPLLSVLQSYTTSGTLFGVSITDDFAGATLWPPSGIPVTDFPIILAALRAAAPGIRFGVRGLTRQFTAGNPGFDWFSCQFVSWRGYTATQFATQEYTQARAWGALICLDLNYVAGGNGASGFRYIDGTLSSGRGFECSPSEIVSYQCDMFSAALAVDGTAAHLAGSMGYRYDPVFLGRPGILNAMATARNCEAALPPP